MYGQKKTHQYSVDCLVRRTTIIETLNIWSQIYQDRVECLSFCGKEMLTLVLTGIFVLSTCSLVQKRFHKATSITYGMLPLNESTTTPTLSGCALQCGQHNGVCESFIYDKVNLYCLFGGRLLTAGIRPWFGQTMYTTGKFYCDTKFGYFLTNLGESELCARVMWTKVTYTAAAIDCTAHQGRLLTIKTAERNDLVLELMRSYNATPLRVWVGLTDIELEGKFVWSDGSSMTADQKILFRASQPDNAYIYGENCCEYIYANSGNGLNDVDCGTNLGFICELFP